MNYKVAVIPGDGIGPEIVREARKHDTIINFVDIRQGWTEIWS